MAGRIIICDHCGREKQVAHLHRDSRFCSRYCFNEWQRKNKYLRQRCCLTCGKIFYPKQQQLDNGQGKYCGLKCRPVHIPQAFLEGQGFKGKKHKAKTIQQLRRLALQRPPTRTGAKLLDKTKEKIADSLKGRFRKPLSERSKNKQIRQLYQGRFEYKEWRDAVFARDGYQCQLCSHVSHGDIEAHHIRPFETYPELRLVVTNGITLCIHCHRKIRTHEKEYEDFFYAKIQSKACREGNRNQAASQWQVCNP